LKTQIGCFQPFSNKRHIRFDIFDKPFSRAFHRYVGGRFHNGAVWKKFRTHDKTLFDAVYQKRGVAV
jgi:hypothetical protein